MLFLQPFWPLPADAERHIRKPENWRMYWKELMHQCVEIGIGSLGIVVIISVFVGSGERRSNILPAGESAHSPLPPSHRSFGIPLSPNSLPPWFVLYWRVWWAARLPARLGNMRVSEQIDALEIMGINTKSYLIMPKIMACLITIPLLVILSMGLGIYGSRLAGVATKILSADTYDQGLLLNFCSLQRILCIGKSVHLCIHHWQAPSHPITGNYKGGARRLGAVPKAWW